MASESLTHAIISPAILYWGTPVVLLTTTNPDGTTSNISPMSSAWWLGHACMLGLDASSHTTQNLLRTKECVLNLPDEALLPAVNALARTTGSNPVSESKQSRGYEYVGDKWTRAGLSPQASDFVRPARVAECPVQMECQLVQVVNMRPDLPDRTGLILAIEVRVLRCHIAEGLRMEGYANRVDPDKWKPIIMNFQEFYGLRDGKIGSSV
jgi:flavin reductase (DIM6/NTAB) family NADH-FMN oxidoreductase RutF